MIKDAIHEILKQPVHVILTIFFIIGVILAFKSIKNQKQRLQNYAEENNDELKDQIDYLANDEELVLERKKRARGNKMFIIFSILGYLYIKNRDDYKFAERFIPRLKAKNI